jgi:hypothetical protein
MGSASSDESLPGNAAGEGGTTNHAKPRPFGNSWRNARFLQNAPTAFWLAMVCLDREICNRAPVWR